MAFLNAQLAAAVIRDIRHKLFGHLQALSLTFYSATSSGEVLSRFSTDLSEVEDTARRWVGMALIPSSEIISATALLFCLNWKLAATAMLIWPLTMAGPRLLSGRTIAATYRKKELEAATLAIVQENISAQPLIRVLGLRSVAQTWFRQRSLPLARISARVNFLTAMAERSVSTAVLFLHLLVLGFGAWLTFGKHMTIGTLITFESVFWELSYNLGFLGEFLPELMESAGAIQHIDDLLREPPGVKDAPGAAELPRIQREIAFANVSFGYSEGESQLRNMNLRIPAGSKVGIVGGSGSGKSTLLSLILRLYDPSHGSIKIDGRDLRAISTDSLWSRTGVVFQETFLFNTSIRENIRAGKQDADDAEVEWAARSAEIHDFIQSLPEGYETNAGERGGLMSGGQRQRIAIARAIIRDPEILILDEATSALDLETEQAILETLYRLAEGRTMIFATHHLASLARADIIFHLENGRAIASTRQTALVP
jgi:ATP-binding cassette subfamily B protein